MAGQNHFHSNEIQIFFTVLWRILYVRIGKDFMRKIVIFFLSISLNKCFGCSKEPSHPVENIEN